MFSLAPRETRVALAPSRGGRAVWLKSYLIGQFKRPRGVVGRLAGWVMATRPSNRLRNAWTVALLDLRPEDRVLEVGYGPGLALEAASRRITKGRIVGLDHSATMREVAAVRNRTAIAEGRMTLLAGSVDDLSRLPGRDLEGPFDKIYGVNVAMFWDDPAMVFRGLKDRLARGGLVAMTHQPRAGDKTDAAALAMAERIADAMETAGLNRVRVERLTELAPMAVCVIATRPENGT